MSTEIFTIKKKKVDGTFEKRYPRTVSSAVYAEDGGSVEATLKTIAPVYDSTKTYLKDAIVRKNGKLYQSNVAISTAEAWNASHWTEISLEIAKKVSDIAQKVNQITPEEEGTSGQVLTLNDEGKAEWKTPQGGGGGTVDAYTKSESDAKYATKEEIEGVVYEEESEELPDGEDVIQKVADLPILPKHYENTLYITDKEGNVIAKIDGSGLETTSIKARNVQYKDWNGKTIATYGDSVVAINNGDSSYPYGDLSTSFNWGKRVAQYFGFAKNYGRGIGGQGYKWTTSGGSGGSVSFIEANGNLNSRNDNYNLDNYTGEIPSGCTAVRGCLASWLRITKMFPASIKDNIDVVLVMAHNDGFDSTDCAFVANDTTDTEWANSGADYYGKINGDYNLTTLKGGIASTLMKLQLWMPNAIIVIMTGISGQGTSGQLNTAINGVLTKNAESVREMSKLTSIPCIDTFASDGINGWNRTSYIADTIHPYNVEGSKMFARSVVGGLKSIMPKDSLNF